MSIQPITPEDQETFTIQTNPSRTYISSSTGGATGSVYLYARHSPIEKDAVPNAAFFTDAHNESNLNTLLHQIVATAHSSSFIYDLLDTYMGRIVSSSNGPTLASGSSVRSQGISARKNKLLDIIRFTPPPTFNSDTVRKLLIKNTLNRFYRGAYPSMQFATTNYYTLNIFTGSSVPTGVALLYPDNDSFNNGQYAPGAYALPSSWSFDFYINPRYTTDFPNTASQFKAATLFHLSSSYAVSLVTGSGKDLNGFPNAFRILLQLSSSAEVAPSLANPGTGSSALAFLSNDNSLFLNNWHHVVIRWGTNVVNFGTGSFVVDGNLQGTFVIPSASVAPPNFSGTLQDNPDALIVGNFYEGNNTGLNAISYFFAADPAARDGIQELVGTTGIDTPVSYSFRHPMNCEIHDLMIKRYYMSDKDILVSSSNGPVDLARVAFYLPPYFTTLSPTRSFVGTYGGVPVTPFFTEDKNTTSPFNADMSFGVGGHLMNIENFTLDFAQRNFPRLLNLTASTIETTTTAALTANTFLYQQQSVALRNLLILPSDDGNFFPNYDFVARTVGEDPVHTNDLGINDYSWINLDNLISTATINPAVSDESGSMFQQLAGVSPESVGTIPGDTLAILQRTKDPSSNEIVIFDISNMFYGNRIFPGSFRIFDSNVSGSSGKVKITLADDGLGNIFRADCYTTQSTWNSVGNIYYNEGLVVIKSPNIPFFGQDQFTVTFKGEQNVHVSRFDILASPTMLNSSSNPSYLPVSASGYPNDPDAKFVYITGLNIHDANFNVIAKTALAQPVVKRVGDRFLFKIKMDW